MRYTYVHTIVTYFLFSCTYVSRIITALYPPPLINYYYYFDFIYSFKTIRFHFTTHFVWWDKEKTERREALLIYIYVNAHVVSWRKKKKRPLVYNNSYHYWDFPRTSAAVLRCSTNPVVQLCRQMISHSLDFAFSRSPIFPLSSNSSSGSRTCDSASTIYRSASPRTLFPFDITKISKIIFYVQSTITPV